VQGRSGSDQWQGRQGAVGERSFRGTEERAARSSKEVAAQGRFFLLARRASKRGATGCVRPSFRVRQRGEVRMSDLSPRDVARQLGISRSAVYRLIGEGELPAYKARGRLRVEPREVQAFKERNRVRPTRRNGSPMFSPMFSPAQGAGAVNGESFLAELRGERSSR
jgi:excisionase family DNA binding protein